MQQVPAQAAHGSIDEYMLVHRVLTPSRMSSIEQPHTPVRISLAVTQPLPEKSVATGHGIRDVARIHEREADFSHQLGRNLLVRIEAKHPLVTRRGHSE